MAERVSVNGTDQYLLIYMYDENGAPIGLKYKDLTSTTKSTYLFGKNAQGDVCEIYNESGTLVGTYHYTAYGEYVISNLSWSTLDYNIVLNYNPFRYRGYYYDSDTRWYYLQSRYYDPEICRFISADQFDVLTATPDQLTDKNLFAYCDNNPVVREDSDGEFWNYVIGAGVGAVVGAFMTAYDAVKNDGWDALSSGKTWAKIGISAVCGAINGTVAASGAYYLTGGAVGAVTGFVESVSHEMIDNNGEMSRESWNEVAVDTLGGFVGGIAGGNGAIRGNKYMTGHVSRFKNHLLPDGLKKSGTLFYKNTATYSKKFILPTIVGIGKGWGTTQFLNGFLTS